MFGKKAPGSETTHTLQDKGIKVASVKDGKHWAKIIVSHGYFIVRRGGNLLREKKTLFNKLRRICILGAREGDILYGRGLLVRNKKRKESTQGVPKELRRELKRRNRGGGRGTKSPTVKKLLEKKKIEWGGVGNNRMDTVALGKWSWDVGKRVAAVLLPRLLRPGREYRETRLPEAQTSEDSQ